MTVPQPTLVLDRVLRVMQPLVRLLVRSGVTYPVFAAAAKRVFLDAARDELAARAMPATDSALTLLSGVHRRDVRQLTRGAGADGPAAATEAALRVQPAGGAPARPGASPASGGPADARSVPAVRPVDAAAPPSPLGLAAQVVGRWITDPAFTDAAADGAPPRVLARGAGAGTFDALVAGVSRDVRPRAVLDELQRLGVACERPDGAVALNAGGGFAPRQGFEELSWLFAMNLHDHAAAAAANLQGEADFLEQALFVDRLTGPSVQAVRDAARRAWRDAAGEVMRVARQRFDADAAAEEAGGGAAAAGSGAALATGDAVRQRLRFGVYFYSEPEGPPP